MSLQSDKEKSKKKRQNWGENEGLIDEKKEGHGEIQYTVHVHMDIRRGGIGKEMAGGTKRGRDQICIYMYTVYQGI